MPVQITVLLALTAGLFDQVPLARMAEAEQAIWAAAANMPADVVERFSTADKLSDRDRAQIIELATQALAGLVPPARAKGEP